MRVRGNGFTLIELMVTIAVLAIIAMMAAPSFGTTLANQQLKRNIMELKASLQEARSQALLTREQSIVCVNKNNTNTVVTPVTCVQKLAGHASMSDALKRSNVFVVELNSKVTFDSIVKDDFFTFSKRGNAAPKAIKLCAGNSAYILTITVAGTIETKLEGTC